MAKKAAYVVKNADMPQEMQIDAVDTAIQAGQLFSEEKDVAAYIKREFDRKYNPTWHCIVGKNFGSHVTFETGRFVYFFMRQGFTAVLLFKAG